MFVHHLVDAEHVGEREGFVLQFPFGGVSELVAARHETGAEHLSDSVFHDHSELGRVPGEALDVLLFVIGRGRQIGRREHLF